MQDADNRNMLSVISGVLVKFRTGSFETNELVLFFWNVLVWSEIGVIAPGTKEELFSGKTGFG